MDTQDNSPEDDWYCAFGLPPPEEFFIHMARSLVSSPKEKPIPYQIIIDIENPDSTIWLFGQEAIDKYYRSKKGS